MSDNSQALAQALAEAEQRVAQLKTQLAQATSKGGKSELAQQPATARMAADMGARAQQGQDFVNEDRFLQQGQREKIQAELRKRLLQFAMPGASPVQVDMARRATAPPVTAGRAGAWQQAQMPNDENWNDPWRFTGG